MRILAGLIVLCGLIGSGWTVPLDIASSWAQPPEKKDETSPPAATVTPPTPEAKPEAPVSARDRWNAIVKAPRPVLWGAAFALLIIGGAAYLIWRTIQAGADPLILRLTPSFFFWLGLTYMALLLLAAAVYTLCFFDDRKPTLLGGVLPIAVPWFGALGAVTISLEGVFLWNSQWDKKYNYWHIGRPLFGAVLGIVAFFLFVAIGAAAGTPPKFLEGNPTPLKDFIIFYIVAFLVGYREETFRELIKRATDLVLKPGTPPPPLPAVTFRVGGATPPSIQFAPVTPPATSSLTVDVQNSGNAPLTAPTVTVTPIGPAAFTTANDHVTGGGDLAPGQARQVDVTFAPPAPGNFSATLSVTAANLPTPATIRVTGQGQ